MTQIQIRRDSSSRWTAVNPILESGELGVELDTHKMKAGDGVLAWNLLPYIGGDDTSLKPGDNVSELVNDANYLVEADVNQILTDGNYLVSGDNVSELVNDANYLIQSDVDQILVDGGYITGVDNLDDIGDVSVAGATENQYLRYNGTNWVAETVSGISDTLQLQGSVDCTSDDAPGDPVAGWFYFNTGTGAALPSWVGITTDVADGDRVVYGNDNQWHILGNINDGGNVTLDSLSVTTVDADGSGALAYNNESGVFTFTPADLTAVQWSDVQNKPSLYTSNSYITSLPVLS